MLGMCVIELLLALYFKVYISLLGSRLAKYGACRMFVSA